MGDLLGIANVVQNIGYSISNTIDAVGHLARRAWSFVRGMPFFQGEGDTEQARGYMFDSQNAATRAEIGRDSTRIMKDRFDAANPRVGMLNIATAQASTVLLQRDEDSGFFSSWFSRTNYGRATYDQDNLNNAITFVQQNGMEGPGGLRIAPGASKEEILTRFQGWNEGVMQMRHQLTPNQLADNFMQAASLASHGAKGYAPLGYGQQAYARSEYTEQPSRAPAARAPSSDVEVTPLQRSNAAAAASGWKIVPTGTRPTGEPSATHHTGDDFSGHGLGSAPTSLPGGKSFRL